jgi:hypothetical protein
MFEKPSEEQLKDIEEKIASSEDNEVSFREFLTEEDRVPPTTLFNDPIEHFIAKVNQHLVTCNLIENNEEIGYRGYLVELEGLYNVGDVFNGRSDFPRSRIAATYREVPGDLRIVPVDGNMTRTHSARAMQIDWSILVFSTYFGLPYFPAGEYFA